MTARTLDRLALTALTALLTTACDDPDAPASGDVAFRTGTGQGGPVFNTNVILGSEVPAADTTGQPLGDVTLLTVELLLDTTFVPVDLGSLHVDHGTLIGTHANITYAGPAFIHSRWTFEVGGQPLTALLTNVETSLVASLYTPGSGPEIRMLDPERLVYTFQYLDPIKQTPISTCAPDAVGGARMVLYGDIVVDHATGEFSERPDTIYFGCLSGAVGKAALWGYAHDSPSLPDFSLDVLETGTRTVRADYCASGQSYTTPGKQLTLQDHWGINEHGMVPFKTEAIWEVGGPAVCVSRIRKTGKVLPTGLACPGGPVIPACGATELAASVQWNLTADSIWTRIP
jgi:hypothetical protein